MRPACRAASRSATLRTRASTPGFASICASQKAMSATAWANAASGASVPTGPTVMPMAVSPERRTSSTASALRAPVPIETELPGAPQPSMTTARP